MYFSKIICIVFLVFLYCTKLHSNQRLICSRADTNEVVNFYISENKLFLSGLSISGTYSTLIKSINGVLAINMSSIGDDSGIELIFIDLNERKFTVKSKIANSKKNTLIEINGICK